MLSVDKEVEFDSALPRMITPESWRQAQSSIPFQRGRFPSIDETRKVVASGTRPTTCINEDLASWCSTTCPSSPALTAFSEITIQNVTTPWNSPQWNSSNVRFENTSDPVAVREIDRFTLPDAENLRILSKAPTTASVGKAFDSSPGFNRCGSNLFDVSGRSFFSGASQASECVREASCVQHFLNSKRNESSLPVPAFVKFDGVAERVPVSLMQTARILPPPGLEDVTPLLREPPPPPTFSTSAAECTETPALELPAGTTTVMLRNIPNKYRQDVLIEKLMGDGGFRGDIDFLYLPVDFINKCNVGYAFINFQTTQACERFFRKFHMARSSDVLPGFNSLKVCEVSAAKVQGQLENIRRLRSSPVLAFLADKPEWQPQLFDKDGTAKPFPPSTKAAAAPMLAGGLGRGRLARRRGSRA
eukprot:TRINITY_DN76364_c0_g1_i1.p1 TRINITY_DN76364_c0_g1~~TRINITY_DN76364_c0_g1_i1.p1  ORF type:complete len:418 (-),score=78.10 TRINITY_DN76364_c0_g1_i1:457-1710(-)